MFLHNVPHRVRIETDVLKSDSGVADEIRKALSTIRGIGTVDIDVATSSILINYNPELTNYREIVGILKGRGLFNSSVVVKTDDHFRGRLL